MRKRDTSALGIVFRKELETGQVLAEDALNIANSLPDTTVDVPIERGVKEGLIVPVREGVFKLVGRGIERE